jgi:hypothetical protein
VSSQVRFLSLRRLLRADTLHGNFPGVSHSFTSAPLRDKRHDPQRRTSSPIALYFGNARLTRFFVPFNSCPGNQSRTLSVALGGFPKARSNPRITLSRVSIRSSSRFHSADRLLFDVFMFQVSFHQDCDQSLRSVSRFVPKMVVFPRVPLGHYAGANLTWSWKTVRLAGPLGLPLGRT